MFCTCWGSTCWGTLQEQIPVNSIYIHYESLINPDHGSQALRLLSFTNYQVMWLGDPQSLGPRALQVHERRAQCCGGNSVWGTSRRGSSSPSNTSPQSGRSPTNLKPLLMKSQAKRIPSCRPQRTTDGSCWDEWLWLHVTKPKHGCMGLRLNLSIVRRRSSIAWVAWISLGEGHQKVK